MFSISHLHKEHTNLLFFILFLLKLNVDGFLSCFLLLTLVPTLTEKTTLFTPGLTHKFYLDRFMTSSPWDCWSRIQFQCFPLKAETAEEHC